MHMPKICYRTKRFSAESQEIVDRANGIVEEYEKQGFDLTLRQLFYQFVSRGLIANKDSEYKRLGSILNDARLAGLVDWTAIVDRTRYLRNNSHWDNPADIIQSAASSYARDKWANQPNRIEVWIEKDALVGVIAQVCKRLDVPYFSCRGYTSASEMWVAGQRLVRYLEDGQEPVILHLGDHDPSGKDMSRDIVDRLELFTGDHVRFQRIALNMDQVDQYDPPPNPAKITDSRASAYIAEFGSESWELDALDPRVLSDLIETAVCQFIDGDRWKREERLEAKERHGLEKAASKWSAVQKYLSRGESK
jgi:hypothetical protein